MLRIGKVPTVTTERLNRKMLLLFSFFFFRSTTSRLYELLWCALVDVEVIRLFVFVIVGRIKGVILCHQVWVC